MGKTCDEGVACDCYETHDDRIAEARSFLPDENTAVDLADFFRLFGDSTRLKILFSLDRGEMCVCDISATLGMTMSAVSHQLRILRDSNLIRSRREGRMVFYSLCDDHVKTILETALEHIGEDG